MAQDIKEEIVNRLAAENPVSTDAQQPAPPPSGGQVGPSPGAEALEAAPEMHTITPSDTLDPDENTNNSLDASDAPETDDGPEPGGVGDGGSDGSTRTHTS
ncbi:MAG: hypothetical protein JWQ02_964 [Capsulimonas sp.]|jgi:hypothetical protein|nr:hypothetical protein [Capsulimonas sp.]